MAKKIEIVSETIEAEKPKEIISFDIALKLYKAINVQANITMSDKEAVSLFVVKYIPSLVSTKEEFFSVLNKF